MHLGCAECVLKWLAAAPVVHSASAASAASRARGGAAGAHIAPCPLCRKPFCRGDMIMVLPPPPTTAAAAAEGGASGSGSGAAAAAEGAAAAAAEPAAAAAAAAAAVDRKGKGKAVDPPATVAASGGAAAARGRASRRSSGAAAAAGGSSAAAAGPSSSEPAAAAQPPQQPSEQEPGWPAACVPARGPHAPGCPPTATEATLRALPPPPALLRRSPVFPAIPVDALSHFDAARRNAFSANNPAGSSSSAPRFSPKISAVLSDLDYILTHADDTAEASADIRSASAQPTAPTRAPTKAVLVSQSGPAVQAVAHAIALRGYGVVMIAPGTPEPERRAAVARFNADASCRCFVLHVGQGAAGLTLTAANYVLLLEPFLSAGDEAQVRMGYPWVGGSTLFGL